MDGYMDGDTWMRMDSTHGRRLHQDATAVPVPGEAESPGTSLGSSLRPCAGARLCNPQARLQHRHIPGAPGAPHPLLPPAVFILRPGGIGCRPGREHQESRPWQTNQTPPKPGEPQGQRGFVASSILDGSATLGEAAPAGNSILPMPATSANPETWAAHLGTAASLRNSGMCPYCPMCPSLGCFCPLR